VNVAGVDAPEDGVAELRAMLEDGQRDGALPAFDSEVAARAIRITIDAASSYLPTVDASGVDHVIGEMVTLFLRSVGADHPG
jgi:hypothetical protein